MLVNKTYCKNTYALDTFEELIPLADNFILATLVLANDSTADVEVEVELVDATNTQVALIVPTYVLETKVGQVLDVRSIGVTGDYALRVKANAAGVSFTASGAISV